MLNIKNTACILAVSVLVFSKGTTGAQNDEFVLNTQDSYNFGNPNDTIAAPRYGIFWRIPGIYRPATATTSTLPACAPACCLTTCPMAAANPCVAGTPAGTGVVGTCTGGTAAGCRSVDPTCAATLCTLAAACMPPAAPTACAGAIGSGGPTAAYVC